MKTPTTLSITSVAAGDTLIFVDIQGITVIGEVKSTFVEQTFLGDVERVEIFTSHTTSQTATMDLSECQLFKYCW